MGKGRFSLTPSRQRLTQLRHHMGHFILNLQIYLQHDVIEVYFQQLKDGIQQSQDFMKAARRHEECHLNIYLIEATGCHVM